MISTPKPSQLGDLVRPAARRVRAIFARTLHPARRRKAEEVVRSAVKPCGILFLCTGNICRSPYAEKAFRRDQAARGGSEPHVVSAGLLEAGRPSPEAAIRIARERGITLDEHRSRTFERSLIARVDLVIAMEEEHERRVSALLGTRPPGLLLLGDLDPIPPNRREILDPWGHPDQVFRESFERIDRCVARLGELLARPSRD
jgi:protein-tyrosine phosphatase